ncbi:MAG: MaoC family dehydratase N-terminal domain-containing protein [Actinobacteria bacterium]|nr:MaoC family dehydratase N-terminal domain-containing protein [Actinomycetota bacterium]
MTAFEELWVGQELFTSSRVVTREDVKAYADASGDQNPLHQDDAVARAAGFPGVIAHGMFTMGTLASAIVERFGGDAMLERLGAQFRSPVFVGETIECGGSVRSVDERARTAVLDVWVRVERDGAEEWPIRRGEAQVRFV